MEDVKQYEGPERRANPRFHSILSAFLRLSVIKEGNPTILELGGETVDISLEGKEGRGVDVGIVIVTEIKRITAVGDVRWFKAEAPNKVAVGILLKGMGREDRRIWEDLVKSMALSL
jgi:hypothetical protein